MTNGEFIERIMTDEEIDKWISISEEYAKMQYDIAMNMPIDFYLQTINNNGDEISPLDLKI